MLSKVNNKKGFTLLEILIASTMFAFVMLMTTATIAGGSSYQTKLKNLRASSEETRTIADTITNNVRNASTKLTITALDSSGTTVTKTFKNGLALLNCHANVCSFAYYNTSSVDIGDGNPFAETNSIAANTLVTSDKTQILVLVNADDNKTVYHEVFPLGTVITGDSIGGRKTAAYVANISSRGSTLTEMAINFGGYCPDDRITQYLFQSYVQFFVTSRTKDFDNLLNTQRALVQIKSTVTSRSYNQ